jgi:hypothetical protein
MIEIVEHAELKEVQRQIDAILEHFNLRVQSVITTRGFKYVLVPDEKNKTQKSQPRVCQET